MINSVFNKQLDWATQKTIAEVFIAKLKASPIAEQTTADYASSMALVNYMLNSSNAPQIQLIEVYHTFVRIVRNEKGMLPLGAVVMDFVRYPKNYQDE